MQDQNCYHNDDLGIGMVFAIHSLIHYHDKLFLASSASILANLCIHIYGTRVLQKLILDTTLRIVLFVECMILADLFCSRLSS